MHTCTCKQKSTAIGRTLLGGFLAMGRSILVTLTHELWLLCCGKLTYTWDVAWMVSVHA
jgi:hypothetical protein